MHISEEINIADLNPNLRINYLDEVIWQIELGIKNKIKKYNIHIDSGVYFTIFNSKYYLKNKYIVIEVKNKEDLIESIKRIRNLF